jgi:hypothetical protein
MPMMLLKEVLSVNRKNSMIFIYILLGFAALGLISTLINNPFQLIKNVLIGAAVVGLIYFIFTRFRNGNSGGEYQAYRKAARKTVKKKRKHEMIKTKRSKHNTHGLTVISKEQLINRPKKKSDVKLTVIEGKKARKKNRALF